ncbi:MAG: hypothetical protein AAF242_15645 [Bacteroidota bacterium]
MDVWQEMREEENKTVGAGLDINLDVALFFLFPIPLPGVYPIYNKDKTEFKAATTTKLVKRTGILEKVIVEKDGSILETENLLYDRLSGATVLTRTQNEFNDAMYSFNYPAYWAYEGMGPAFENIGSLFADETIAAGQLALNSTAKDYLKPGDEILLLDDNGNPEPQKYFVSQATSELNLMDANGNLLDRPGENLTIKVIRSGKKNMLGASMGQVASRQNPLQANNLVFDANTEVLSSGSAEFDDFWPIDCGATLDECGDPILALGPINPYVEGLQGRWRPKSTNVFYGNRSPNALPTGSARIRNAGVIPNFSPYWQLQNNTWTANPSTEWILSNQITLLDAKGNELENQDALGIYSSAQFGYNQTLAMAVAGNAKHQEIYFDGFEDYAFDNQCGSTFSYDRNLPIYDAAATGADYELTEGTAHTGKFALKFGAGKQSSILMSVGDNCPDGEPTGLVNGKGYASPDNKIFETICYSCLPDLNPLGGKEYYLSAWVATETSISNGGTVDNGRISVAFDNGGMPYTFTSFGPVIDGWQRIEGRFMVPAGASTMVLNLSNSGSTNVYFDDFRFHPAISNMQSYVYDPYSLRLMATLDENNYASFYEYDDEGLLIRTKRETEKGIITLQEGRTSLKSNNTTP